MIRRNKIKVERRIKMKKYVAEFIGTFVLVFFGTGIAVVSNGNLVATALAFGLAIIAEAYVIGNISGCHVNPAVSLAMLITGKMKREDFAYYVIAQILGAILGTGILFLILSGTSFGTASLGANYFGELTSNNISLIAALITEIVLTCVFVYTIIGVTSDDKYSSVSGIVIGLTLTFVHLIGIPLTGTSVNPARSLAPAIFLMGDAIKQVWVFIVAPLIGGALAAYLYEYLNIEKKKKH